MKPEPITPQSIKLEVGDDDYYMGNITLNGKDVAMVRWGCDCCWSHDPLTEKEINMRNTIITAVNSQPLMMRAMECMKSIYNNSYGYKMEKEDYDTMKAILKEWEGMR